MEPVEPQARSPCWDGQPESEEVPAQKHIYIYTSLYTSIHTCVFIYIHINVYIYIYIIKVMGTLNNVECVLNMLGTSNSEFDHRNSGG